MRRAIALLLALSGLAGCGEESPSPSTNKTAEWQGPPKTAIEPTGRLDRSHAGTAAPAAAFQDPDGNSASVADFKGKPLLVNLWATWCAPCVAEMPTLDRLAAREQGKLQVLALSQDFNGSDKVTAFFAARDFAMLEPYLDPRTDFMAALKIDVLPTTILYDANSREVWRMTGIEDWESERAAELIAEGSAP
jgi:thiol-disulfide isomerase/thioredoxin